MESMYKYKKRFDHDPIERFITDHFVSQIFTFLKEIEWNNRIDAWQLFWLWIVVSAYLSTDMQIQENYQT